MIKTELQRAAKTFSNGTINHTAIFVKFQIRELHCRVQALK